MRRLPRFRVHPKWITDMEPPKPEVKLEAKEVSVTGENVVVEGQDEATKQRERADVAKLAERAVSEEDHKRANALLEAARVAQREFWKSVLVILIAAIPPTVAAVTAAFIAYSNSIVTASTHRLVNSGSLIQLKTNLRSAKRIYMLTMDPEDQMDVVEAEKLIEEHIVKQKLADEGR